MAYCVSTVLHFSSCVELWMLSCAFFLVISIFIPFFVFVLALSLFLFVPKIIITKFKTDHFLIRTAKTLYSTYNFSLLLLLFSCFHIWIYFFFIRSFLLSRCFHYACQSQLVSGKKSKEFIINVRTSWMKTKNYFDIYM